MRQYLELGNVLNKRRVRDLDAVNTILKRALRSRMEPQVQADFLSLLDRYEHGLSLLDQYDHGSLDGDRYAEDNKELYRLTYQDAREQVDRWKWSRYGEDRKPLEGTPAYKLDLFGVEKMVLSKPLLTAFMQAGVGKRCIQALYKKRQTFSISWLKNTAFQMGISELQQDCFFIN